MYTQEYRSLGHEIPVVRAFHTAVERYTVNRWDFRLVIVGVADGFNVFDPGSARFAFTRCVRCYAV